MDVDGFYKNMDTTFEIDVREPLVKSLYELAHSVKLT